MMTTIMKGNKHMKPIIFILVVLISVPFNVFAEEKDNYVYEADYYSLDGVKFGFKINEETVPVIKAGNMILEHTGQLFEVCSDEKYYCFGQIVIPKSDNFADTSWQVKGSAYKATSWFELELLGDKHKVILISEVTPQGSGKKYDTYKYMYTQSQGLIAIEIPFFDTSNRRIVPKTFFLHSEKGLGAKK